MKTKNVFCFLSYFCLGVLKLISRKLLTKFAQNFLEILYKNLTVLNNDHWLPVKIEVTTDLNDSLVIVKIYAYSKLDDDSFPM